MEESLGLADVFLLAVSAAILVAVAKSVSEVCGYTQFRVCAHLQAFENRCFVADNKVCFGCAQDFGRYCASASWLFSNWLTGVAVVLIAIFL